ncbi:MAG: protein kinase [Deltaproteobacteria bacterium]|nr:protein kinase [Deltaproteobacteria bacterium]
MSVRLSDNHSGTIAPGTVVGGRIVVERTVREDATGALMFARDAKTRKSIALYVLSKTAVENEEEFSEFRAQIKEASKLKHRNVVATYGVGTYSTSTYFAAREWVEGVPLSDFILNRKKTNRMISVRGAYNVVTHLCKALAQAHEITFHGALRPSTVWVTKSGRVKISDFGITRALLQSGKWKLLEEQEQAYLAPEIRMGGRADARCDIFGLGALLYVLLTGRSPTETFIPPSQANPDATPQIDAVLMKCLAADPSARFASPLEVSEALLPVVAETPAPREYEFDFDVEVDVDIAASLAPPGETTKNDDVVVTPKAAPLPAFPQKAAPPPLIPVVKPQPVAVANGFPDPTGLPSDVESNESDSEPSVPRTRQSEVDLNNLLKKITENDAPRWMVVKDNLDHGPFSGRELVQLIVKGDVLADHSVLNIDTGERKKVIEYPEFVEFIEQQKIRKSEEAYQQALVRSTKIEKRANFAKFIVLTSGIAVVGLAATIFLITRQSAEEEKLAHVDLAALFESGQVKITGTADILSFKRGGRRRDGRRSGDSNRQGGGYASYEDAMNQAIDLGDAKKRGGERQLRSDDIAGVMNRRLNSLFGCVSQELRRGGRLGTVRIDMAIAGSGDVMGTSILVGSMAFKSCIADKVRKIRFPPFPAPRMGARYSFNVD